MATERIEDYLEAIDDIVREKESARAKDICDHLDVKPSSVTEMLQKLDKKGFIKYEKYQGVTLTKKGKGLANETREKHDMLKEFLEIIGLNAGLADHDACKLEHILNPETLDRLTKFVEFVKHSPKDPKWLDHFKCYYETGEYKKCELRAK
jgi:DtxR family Mn-dependent transcriptional regulator